MKKENTKRETKQSVREVFSNNAYLLKLIFKASPSFVIFFAIDAIRGQLSVFFEHTVLIGYVIEAAEYGYPFKRVGGTILLVAALITLGMIFTVYTGDYIRAKERPKVGQAIKMMLYEKASELDLECYDNPEFYNNQVLAIQEADKQIDRGMQFVNNTLSGITVFVSSGIYFLMKDKASILFVAASFALSFVFNLIYNRQNFLVRIESNPFSRERDYIKRIFYLSDYAKEIRLNPDASDVLFKRFNDANDEVYRVEKKYAGKKFFLAFMKDYFSNAMISDVLYIGYLIFCAAVLKTLSFGSVVILYNSFGRLKRGMQVFTDAYPFASETSLYVGKIRAFLDTKPSIVSEEGLVPREGAKDIELRDMSFAYRPEGEMLLKNINLHIKKGEKVALVGYNGAGKTTLVKLLMRLYDVNSGEIIVDGDNIKKYDLNRYRDSIGTVFQDFAIFAGSVTENVILDTPDNADTERVRNALSDSGFLERGERLKDGIFTELTTEFSKDGVNLSGGEAQKLAIARAFYKDAGLLILDEPSSALDPIAEYQLNRSMLEATGGRTVIFISHRLSTTRHADRIIMLENGVIAEEGTHEELLRRNGKYAEMWQVQAGAYIDVEQAV